jgi:hypothetical protein
MPLVGAVLGVVGAWLVVWTGLERGLSCLDGGGVNGWGRWRCKIEAQELLGEGDGLPAYEEVGRRKTEGRWFTAFRQLLG